MRTGRFAALLGAALMLPAAAIAGDKTQATMVNPATLAPVAPPVSATSGPSSTSWTNGVSKGKSGGDTKCKTAIQLGGVALPDSDGVPGTGDEVICISSNNVTQAGVQIPTALVSRGEIKGGKVKIKHDLSVELPGLCVPAGGGSNTANYFNNTTCYEPAAYPPPGIPLTSDPTQGVWVGGAPAPGSPIIATEGLYFQ
ncbi:MAG: hypothetical protein U0807_13015 [Candidatus Binatia bacterium]